jgi:terminase small subunit-like protein
VFIDGERLVNDHARVQRARLKVGTLKWIMSKLAPKRYGDWPELAAEAEPKQLTPSWIEGDCRSGT